MGVGLQVLQTLVRAAWDSALRCEARGAGEVLPPASTNACHATPCMLPFAGAAQGRAR